MHDFTTFLLTVLVILGTPGPTNTLLATSGAMMGVVRSLPLIIAELAGYIVSISALHGLLGGFIASYQVISVGLRIAVAAYLVLTAMELWERDVFSNDHETYIGIVRVFLTTLLNPKAFIFAFVVFPFDASDVSTFSITFCALVVAVGATWIVLGGLIGRAGHGAMMRFVPRAAAIALCAFAGMIALGI